MAMAHNKDHSVCVCCAMHFHFSVVLTQETEREKKMNSPESIKKRRNVAVSSSFITSTASFSLAYTHLWPGISVLHASAMQ